MTNATLEGFRQIHAAMQNAPSDWQWLGRWESQRHFGITEARAKELQDAHGGVASAMRTEVAK
jgi:hypothetical protein